MFPYAIVQDPAILTDDQGLQLLGVEGRPLSAWFEHGLAVIVGETAPRTQPEAFLDVVAQICELQPAIPTQATDDPMTEQEASRLLCAGRDRFRSLLHIFEDCAEWSIRIDPPSKPSAETESEDDGGRSYLEQKRLEFDRRAGIDATASKQAARFARAFSPIARELKVLAASDGAACVAMLVPASDAGDLTHIFEKAAANAPCPCTLSGPWPPFSFASLAA